MLMMMVWKPPTVKYLAYSAIFERIGLDFRLWRRIVVLSEAT